ncbi:hypothetical protein [Pseudoxanthomonas wuyuanensis]
MLVRNQMKITRNFVGFVAIIVGLIATFLIEATLIHGGGGIGSVTMKFLYNAIFFACPIILLINLVGPIFKSPVFSKPVAGRFVLILTFLDVALFQSVAILGLGSHPEFQSLYLKHFLLLQAINLLFLWACVCALVGQDRFHPFLRDVMRNPFGAIGYWLGYGATQVGQAKKTRRKR